MMVTHDRTDIFEESQFAAEAVADHRMLLHHGKFRRIERAALQQYRIRNPDLAYIVKKSSPMQCDLMIVAKPKARAQRGRVLGETIAMAPRVWVACLDRQREAQND